MWDAHIASNMNFPAPVAVLGFLAAAVGFFVAIAAAPVLWFARKPKLARIVLQLMAAGSVIYFGLLFGCSLGSRPRALPRGAEKYFCEIDCHLAYSIVDVKTQPDANRVLITLRTRFDETTTSPSRPKDVPLIPSPRIVRLVDESDREYAPLTVQGTPLLTCLKPGDSYTTDLTFRIPAAKGLRLLVQTAPDWPDHVVIGDENSWLHQKTYFAL